MEEAAVSIIGLKELLQLPEHVNATNGLNLCIHGLLISICSWLTLLMVTDAFLLIKHVNGSLQQSLNASAVVLRICYVACQ